MSSYPWYPLKKRKHWLMREEPFGEGYYMYGKSGGLYGGFFRICHYFRLIQSVKIMESGECSYLSFKGLVVLYAVACLNAIFLSRDLRRR